jgi:hypothetical protein
MIIDWTDIGGPWQVLPPGIHDATVIEVRSRFAFNESRKSLLSGFILGATSLWTAGCTSIYLDGSFVSSKTMPGDFDACWDPIGVDPSALIPELLIFDHKRKAQKAKFGGEFFPSSAPADGHLTFLEFFQRDRHTGTPKGIIRVVP